MLDTWGSTLIGTGGIIKPEKCFYYLWDFECIEGTWEYADLRDHPDLKVPTSSGSGMPIKQLPVTSSKKTLGLYANPAGCSTKQVDVLCDDVQTWTGRLCSSGLPTKWGWTSYRQQLWPKLAYGLGTNAAMVGDFEGLSSSRGGRSPVSSSKSSMSLIVAALVPKP